MGRKRFRREWKTQYEIEPRDVDHLAAAFTGPAGSHQINFATELERVIVIGADGAEREVAVFAEGDPSAAIYRMFYGEVLIRPNLAPATGRTGEGLEP